MTKPHLPQPTKAELDILRVLWRQGPTTVRSVHEALGGTARVRYTTVLKILQNMNEKGLVRRDASRHAHVYRAAYNEELTRRQLVKDLLDRASTGRPGNWYSRSFPQAGRQPRSWRRSVARSMNWREVRHESTEACFKSRGLSGWGGP